MDFFELGNDANMIAYDKLKEGDLTKEQKEQREEARKKRISVRPSTLQALNQFTGARPEGDPALLLIDEENREESSDDST